MHFLFLLLTLSQSPEGCFRASFEDKILMSDIVFMRAWVPVEPRKAYFPVTSLLQTDKTRWDGMRTVGQLRREARLKAPVKKDSKYTKVERVERKFAPLKIPKTLQASLPFASKPKDESKKNKDNYMTKRAVVLETDEKKLVTLMQQISTLKNEKLDKRAAADAERRAGVMKRKAAQEEVAQKRQKVNKKKFFSSKAGKESTKRAAGGAGRGGARNADD